MIARRLNWSPDARLMARQLGGAWLCGSAQNVFALYAEYARSFFSGSRYSVLVY